MAERNEALIHKLTMLTLNVLIFISAIASSLRSADPPLFHTNTGVKMLNEKSFENFKKVMKEMRMLFL
jgi:hypothetical protein